MIINIQWARTIEEAKSYLTYKLRITSLRKFMEVIGVRHPRHILKIYLR